MSTVIDKLEPFKQRSEKLKKDHLARKDQLGEFFHRYCVLNIIKSLEDVSIKEATIILQKCIAELPNWGVLKVPSSSMDKE
jgi:hypothetical protein